MPREDHRKTPDNQEFTVLPTAEYLCAAEKVREGATKAGDLMWGVQFEVVEGEHEGRKVFDNIVFSEASASRRKLIFSRLGFDVTQPFDVEPRDIIGKKVYLNVEQKVYENKLRNKVKFDGYRSIGEDTPATDFDMPDGEVPF